ncbi:MAG: fatty acid desaturase [Verrucomicrobiales bacterium]|nr:fatty acid desaturase [Verrucomicrobiales bacterium]
MIHRIPFDRVNWTSSLFLTITFFTAVIGTPIYFIKFGVDPFLIAMAVVYFILTGMSITLGYHRLFAHRAFKAKAPVKLGTLIFGACAFEDSALDWSSDHRQHHKHVDQEEDPYDISKGFFWAHMGWIFFKLYPRPLANVADLKKDPLVMWQHRWHRQIGMLAGIVLPTLIGLFWSGPVGALGGFLIAGVARVVAVQHCTFLINSLCHTMGRRPYDSRTSARDSFLMAIFTFGEGYHNYHHSFQHDYRNGVKVWQWDPTKWAIWIFSKLGLASELRRVPDEKILLAELRETQRQAELKLAALEASRATGAAETAAWDAAWEKIQQMADQVGKNYADLEAAATEGVRVSRKVLARWKAEATEYLENLTALDELQPQPA